MEKKPHKHAELIKQWADGESIQLLRCDGSWGDTINPDWDESIRYRVKLDPVIDFRYFKFAIYSGMVQYEQMTTTIGWDLKITYHDDVAVKSDLRGIPT